VLHEYLAATPKNPRIQELLTALQAEQGQKNATQQAIAAARRSTERNEFPAAFESLQSVVHAYGDSAELTAELQRVEASRAAFATDALSKSIEMARAALLKNDADRALSALKGASEMVEFADPAKQADWKRMAQSAKKALQQPGSATTVGADFIGAISDAPPAKSRTPLILGVAAACVVLVAIVAFVVLKRPVVQPPPTVEAHIVVAKAPPGALVSIDGKPAVAADAQGNLSIVVTPGAHKLVVSEAGFESFSEDISVGVGEKYREPIPTLTPVGKSGKLVLAGIPKALKVKVFVDDVFKGTVAEGAPISIEAGPHRVRYQAPGYEDSSNKPIAIALNSEVSDTFNLTPLKPPLPDVGNLIVDTNPFAHIVLDNNKRADADQNGKYTFENLAPGTHTVDVSLEKFISVPGKTVQVQAKQYASLVDHMEPVPVPVSLAYFKGDPLSIDAGQSTTLSWQVNNASSVTIEGIGSVGPNGSQLVSPDHTTTYQLSANGGGPLGSVMVTVRPKAVIKEPPPPPPPPKNPMPTFDELNFAVGAYKSVFVRASSKSTRECQSILNTPYQGVLKPLGAWCDNAKSFEAVEKCSAPPAGTEDSPTLTCSEVLTIVGKDGIRHPYPSQKTFHFAKSADGTWLVNRVQ
jgi:hypothetical protein